ncbi:hypothetical protein [Sphingomonas sp. GC_Shp_3]|uniref:hypothetical protein n=1 Tax=Sphingomonas sp. GC_Shp_3 TaxID=2937383 RepID=UPI00226AFDD2|nr:hypothetical protein [Sphingomonas sp. GC_Shp_3]
MLVGFVFVVIGFIAICIVMARRISAVQRAKVATLSTIEGFTPAVTYDGLPGCYGVSIDTSSEQIALIGVGVPPKVFRFDQLIEVGVERDGNTVTTTNGRSGIAGGAVGLALIGPLGLALGGATRSVGTTTSKVTELSLKLYFSDLVTPFCKVEFYKNSAGGGPNNGALTLRAKTLEEWYGRFRTILSQGHQRVDEVTMSALTAQS